MKALAFLALAWAAPAQAMDYSIGPPDEFRFLYAKGPIEEGDAHRFREFLAALPPWKGHTIVNFTSSGGVVEEALAIGAIVEKSRFATSAWGAQCSSACVLPWAAGDLKFAVRGTCVGVHNATVTGLAEQSRAAAAADRITLQMATWVVAHGAPHEVMEKMITTPNGGLYCLSAEDLTAWGAKMVEDK